MKNKVDSVIFGILLLLAGASVDAQKTPPADSFLPILGTYSNQSVPLGGSAAILPDTGASGIGTATVSVSGNFRGTATIAPASATVRLVNASPAGTYTVTVRAADFAGFTVTRSFALVVTNVSSCNTLDFTGIRASVGINPAGLVVADFNGDGRPDAATANTGSNNISVLLGNGGGSFGTVTNFDLTGNATTPAQLAVGDFNGDGKPDLATAVLLGGTQMIAVFTGTGTGGFFPAVNYSPGGNFGAGSLGVGDFNGDGRADIAAGSITGNGVAILMRNAANNGFDAVANISLGFSTTSLAVADFNADGRHDLVVGRNGATTVVTLIRNASNNGFDQVSLPLDGSAGQVTVGDFTGDGRPDIAVSFPGGIDLLPRNALGFDPAIPTSGLVGSPLEAGDFNADGRLDLAFVTSNQPTAIYRNAANTGFDAPVNLGGTGFNVTRLAAADLTGDGRLDLAALNFIGSQPGSVSVLRRNGTNTGFDLAPTQTLGSTNVADTTLADFDNDGRADAAAATLNSPTVAIYKGAAGGAFTNLTSVALGSGNSNGTLVAADFTSDGNADLIVGNATVNGFALLTGAGNGSFAAAIDFNPLNLQTRRFAAGDFNGDGRTDLAVGWTNNQFSIFLRNAANSGFDAPVTFTLAVTASSLAVGDFNADGRADLAVGLQLQTGFSVILRNAANNGFDAPVTYSGSVQNGQLTTADFDGDGNLDIALGASSVLVYYGSPAGVFGAPVTVASGIGAGFLESADFNGDGRPDIVAAVSSFSYQALRSTVAVLARNAANNGFDTPVGMNGSYILSNSLPQRVIVGEFNGDGRPDLLVVNSANSPIQWNFSVMQRVCTVDLNRLGPLPDARAGQSYSKTLAASGGVAPYNFTVAGLPPGLNYTSSGDTLTIFGTPTAGGRFDVTVTVGDSTALAAPATADFAPQAANSLTQVLPLAVAFAPTAAEVSVAGRVLTPDGRGLSGALVVITDQNGGRQTVRSASFGGYRFERLEAGRTYIISVVSKNYRFAPRVLTLDDDAAEFNLTAE